MRAIQTSFFLKGLTMTGAALLITQLGVRQKAALLGVAFGAALVNLNPNRATLSYRATLYQPTTDSGYVVRVRVFGNYE
jgi:hypothetical protein